MRGVLQCAVVGRPVQIALPAADSAFGPPATIVAPGCLRHATARVDALERRVPEVPQDVTSPTAPSGDVEAHSVLFTSLYDELRRIAQRELRRGVELTLSAHTLLHEAYFRMQQRPGAGFASQGQFLAYASRVMRNLVIDFARRRQAQKRGNAYAITSLPTQVPEQTADAVELERLAAAIDVLETLDAQLAELVNLKFFCGYSFDEIAVMRKVSERTVQRDWRKARLLLQRALEGRSLLPE